MSVLHSNNIKGITYRGSNAIAAYVGSTKIYPLASPENDCYAIANTVAEYTGDYAWLWVESENKWYRRNDQGFYEPYGVYGTSIEPYEHTDYTYVYGQNLPEALHINLNDRFIVDGLLTQPTGTLFMGNQGVDTNDYRIFFINNNLYFDYGNQRLIVNNLSSEVDTPFHIEFGNGYLKGRWGDVSFNLTGDRVVSHPQAFDINLEYFKLGKFRKMDEFGVSDFVIVGKQKADGSYGLYNNIDKVWWATIPSGVDYEIHYGETTYEGKLAIVNNQTYEWNGSRWYMTGQPVTNKPVITSNNFLNTDAYKGYSGYTVDGPDGRTLIATYPYSCTLNVYCQIYANNATSVAPYTWLRVYINDALVHEFKGSKVGRYDYSHIFNYNAGDIIRITGKKQDANTNSDLIWSMEEPNIIIKQYEPKDAPENPMVFDSVEDMNAYECVFEGMLAVVGDDNYIYEDGMWVTYKEYDIVDDIKNYTGTAPWVWATSNQKWYRRNDQAYYEEYGVFGDSIEPYRVETLNICKAEFNTGAYYVTDYKVAEEGVRFRVQFTTPSAWPSSTSMLFGVRPGSTANQMCNVGYTNAGVLRIDAGSTTKQTGTYTLSLDTSYIINYWVVNGKYQCTLYSDTGSILYNSGGVAYSGTFAANYNLGINTMMTGNVNFVGFTQNTIIKEVQVFNSTSIGSSTDLIHDYIFLEDGTMYNKVTGYRTNIKGGTGTFTPIGGSITLADGETTYKGKLSVSDNKEYEWNGSAWTLIGDLIEERPVITNNTFNTDGTYKNYTAYKAPDSTERTLTATYSRTQDVTVYCYAFISSASYSANTWLNVYVNGTLVNKFQRTTAGSGDLEYVISYNEGDVITFTGRKNGTNDTSSNLRFSMSSGLTEPKQYEPKPAPEAV